jgi:hypothetical protein
LELWVHPLPSAKGTKKTSKRLQSRHEGRLDRNRRALMHHFWKRQVGKKIQGVVVVLTF